MNKIISLVLFLAMVFIAKENFAQSVKKLTQDTVIWSSNNLLVKEYFKSKGKGKAPAFSAVGILFYPKESDADIKFYVEAIFLKSKSYMRDSSAYALKHEQLHFDICELYARKLRQRLSEKDFKKVKNIQDEIGKLYTKTSEEMNKEEERYDEDTEGGMNSAKQQVWIEDIAKRLAELKEYSETEIDITN